jgi:hypothetical protein
MRNANLLEMQHCPGLKAATKASVGNSVGGGPQKAPHHRSSVSDQKEQYPEEIPWFHPSFSRHDLPKVIRLYAVDFAGRVDPVSFRHSITSS